MSSHRLKVLHCLGSMNRGGVENWLIQVLQYLDLSQFEIEICCLDANGDLGVLAPTVEALGVRIFACPLTRHIGNFTHRFDAVLTEGNYDVVHSHVHLFSGYLLWRARQAGVNSRIAHSHTSVPQGQLSWPRWVYEKGMRMAIGRVATLGLGASAEAMSNLFGVQWRGNPKWQLLPYGIDLTPFATAAAEAAPLRAKLGIPAHAKVIGHVGRFTAAKNHRFLLEIARHVQTEQEDVWVVLVGWGDLLPELKALVAEWQMPRVLFIESPPAIHPYLYLFDILLFPSLWEGLPIVLLEAQAAGLPCLCSTAVPLEAILSPDSMQRLTLNAPIEEWVKNCKTALNMPRLAANVALSHIIGSPYHIANSAQSLAIHYIYRVSY